MADDTPRCRCSQDEQAWRLAWKYEQERRLAAEKRCVELTHTVQALEAYILTRKGVE